MRFEFCRPSGVTLLLEISAWMLSPNVTGDVSVHDNERRLSEWMQPCRQQTQIYVNSSLDTSVCCFDMNVNEEPVGSLIRGSTP